MALRQFIAASTMTLCGVLRAAAGTEAVAIDDAPAATSAMNVAAESPCKIGADSTSTGYFDLSENRFGCWPNEAMMDASPGGCESSVYQSSTCGCPGNGNPCGENPPYEEDYWTSPCDRQIVLATVGMTIFRTDFRGTSLSNQSADLTSNSDGAFAGATYAPRVLLETQGPEWGVLGRFWYLSDGDADFTPLGVNGSAIGLNSTTRTRACTADLEANRRWRFLGCGEIDTSVGFRYASLSADGILNSVSVVGPNVYDSFSAMSTQFNGSGITSGVEARLPLAENAWLCRGCTLNLFGTLRGSAVFGKSVSDTTASSRITTGLGTTALVDTDVSRETSTLLIGETSCGLEWDRRWSCIPADAFFRIAAEYQSWSMTSPASTSSTTSLSAVGQFADANARASDSDVSLVGVAITTGFTW